MFGPRHFRADSKFEEENQRRPLDRNAAPRRRQNRARWLELAVSAMRSPATGINKPSATIWTRSTTFASPIPCVEVGVYAGDPNINSTASRKGYCDWFGWQTVSLLALGLVVSRLWGGKGPARETAFDRPRWPSSTSSPNKLLPALKRASSPLPLPWREPLAWFQVQGCSHWASGSQPTTTAEFDARLAFVQPEIDALVLFEPVRALQPAFLSFLSSFLALPSDFIRSEVDITFHALQVIPAMSLFTATVVCVFDFPCP
jgi:hypothetical protein